MSWGEVIWLTLLACKLYDYNSVNSFEQGGHPLIGFNSTFLMQAVNPKTWMMAFAVISVYTKHEHKVLLHILILSFIFLLVALPCLCIWTLADRLSQRLFSQPKYMKIFNKLMSLTLLISIWWPIISNL